MDPKASAKSKRSHTQRGRKSHPTPSAIAQKKKQEPAASASGGGAGEENSKQSPGRFLPSNWDRYDENEEEMASMAGDETSVGTTLGYSEASPKSRGADFRYLIEQARSQKPKQRQLDHKMPFHLEDFSLGLIQGKTSMLAAKGIDLASCLEDDNFIIDEPMSSYEVPFLSMDLHAVADHLSTLKLSERLFIEADFFPEELCDESEERQIYDKAQKSKEGIDKYGVGSRSGSGHMSSEKNVERVNTILNSDQGMMVEVHQILPSREDMSTRAELFHNEVSHKSTPKLSMRTFPVLEHETSSNFKTTEAEAELDMLLDSLSKTNISASSSNQQSNSMPVPYNSELDALSDAGNQIISSSIVVGPGSLDSDIDGLVGETSIGINMKQNAAPLPKAGTNPSTLCSLFFDANASSGQSTQTSILNDNLDDLLAETSVGDKASLPKEGRNASAVNSVFFGPNTSFGQPNLTSTIDDDLDDLLAMTSLQETTSLPKAGISPLSKDSLFFNGNASEGLPTRATILDDNLDDLLAETSVSLDNQNTAGLQKQEKSSVNFPSKSPLGTKATDDFDSWFDRIQ